MPRGKLRGENILSVRNIVVHRFVVRENVEIDRFPKVLQSFELFEGRDFSVVNFEDRVGTFGAPTFNMYSSVFTRVY